MRVVRIVSHIENSMIRKDSGHEQEGHGLQNIKDLGKGTVYCNICH